MMGNLVRIALRAREKQELTNNDVNGTYPGETNGSNAVRKHVAQNGRERVARWEESVKLRVLPMGHTWHDLGFDVRHDLLPFLAFLRSFIRDESAQVTRFHIGSYASIGDRFHIFGDVIDHLAATLTEFFRIHSFSSRMMTA